CGDRSPHLKAARSLRFARPAANVKREAHLNLPGKPPMKRICIGLLVLTAAAPAQGAASLKEARQRWLRGNYEEGRGLYEELATDASTRDAARIGLSHALQSQGEYDKALTVIDDALKEGAGHAGLHARRAELLYLRGRWEEAEKAAEK